MAIEQQDCWAGVLKKLTGVIEKDCCFVGTKIA